MLKSEKYYVKVVFENVEGKILDGESKTKTKDPTDLKTKKKVTAKQIGGKYL